MNDYYLIYHDNHNPFFNLASEELLLYGKNDFYIYFWINSPAVIVGRNQNTVAEVNLRYNEEHNIKVVRRMSGGGAVYHDEGNICYTFIAPYNKEINNFRYFSELIFEFLLSLGLNPTFSGRNDILLDGKKISGTAEFIHGNRILHHGTLLYDTDINNLSKSLSISKLKLESKGIKSAKSRVTNIKEHLSKKMTTKEFFEKMVSFYSEKIPRYEFTTEDEKTIESLIADKYSTYEWNIGNSPKGDFFKEMRFEFGTCGVMFSVTEGKLENVNFIGDFFCKGDLESFQINLEGVKYIYDDILSALKNVGQVISGADDRSVAELFFGR